MAFAAANLQHLYGPSRVTKALALSLLLHAAILAGWGLQGSPAPTLNVFEPISVHLVAEVRPLRAAAASRNNSTPLQARSSTTADSPAADERADSAAGAEQPLVEARSDVAALNNPRPPYPLAARRQGVEGLVLLSALVRSDGVCADVRIKRSSGHALLDDAARNTVRHWRFVPAWRSGTAVESWKDVPIRFRLEG